MKREDRRVAEAYIAAVLSEREAFLYQGALSKVRVITRSMSAEEKEAYLRSEPFRNTLRQLQRRDRVYQGLVRGELVQPGAKSELERLSRLIASELTAGRRPDLPFLRTVEKSRVSLEKAYSALQAVHSGMLRSYYEENIGRLTSRAESRFIAWLRSGDLAVRLQEPRMSEDLLPSACRRTAPAVPRPGGFWTAFSLPG